MRLLEFESKVILAQKRISIPLGERVTGAKQPGLKPPYVLKAQVPIGGRRKSGGVLEAATADEAAALIEQLLARPVRGYRAKSVLVEEKVDTEHEFFLAVTYDTVAKRPIAMFSTEGGVDIETLAAREPQKVAHGLFSVRTGLPEYRSREIIAETGITGKLLPALGSVFSRLAEIFISCDAIVAEINPLALARDGRLIALDCHLEVDEDALFRQPSITSIADGEPRWEASSTITDFERQAAAIDQLDHRGVAGRVIEFDGDLGLIIGGGGASLTAFDAIRAHGGRPANYCEIGGNPSVLKVKELTRLILSKSNVKKIAVIMNVVSNTRVDLVARGIIKGILEAGKVPGDTIAVFRVPGAWEEEGQKILSKYGVRFCDRTVSIDTAAKLAVAAG